MPTIQPMNPIEQLRKVIDFAHAKGFDNAVPAYWNVDQAERPMEGLDCDPDGDTVIEVDLGVFLHAKVFVASVFDPALDNYRTQVFTSPEKAEAFKDRILKQIAADES